MSVRVTIELPEDAFAISRTSPDNFAKEMRLAAAVKWYEMGRLSQSKAAQLAGISRREFLDVLPRFDVTPFQVTPEELEADLLRG